MDGEEEEEDGIMLGESSDAEDGLASASLGLAVWRDAPSQCAAGEESSYLLHGRHRACEEMLVGWCMARARPPPWRN